MIVAAPPYALSGTAFPLPSLATLAGRGQLGGEREVALACLLAAHVAIAVVADAPLSRETRTARAGGARNWLAAVAIPAAVRRGAMNVVAASEDGDLDHIGSALSALAAAAAQWLDEASQLELQDLLARRTS